MYSATNLLDILPGRAARCVVSRAGAQRGGGGGGGVVTFVPPRPTAGLKAFAIRRIVRIGRMTYVRGVGVSGKR